MTAIGVITSLWRYPVKSMGGEQIVASPVDQRGLRGDRGLALYTPAGKIASGKNTRRFTRIGGLLQYRAHVEPDGTVTITTPDRVELRALDPATDAELSERLGQAVAIRGEGAVAHHDECAVHLITDHDLGQLQRRCPDADLDHRRFRPNVIVERIPGSIEPRPGHELRTDANVRLVVDSTAERCPMVTHPQPGLTLDRSLMQVLTREFDNRFGLYLRPATTGTISVGDQILLDR